MSTSHKGVGYLLMSLFFCLFVIWWSFLGGTVTPYDEVKVVFAAIGALNLMTLGRILKLALALLIGGGNGKN